MRNKRRQNINNCWQFAVSNFSFKKCVSQDLFDCLRVNHVSFKIGDTKEFILEDININFEKNKKYAIVGSSGSGKTTLLRLILGLYKDIQGNILANTENLKNISLTEWREHYISSQK